MNRVNKRPKAEGQQQATEGIAAGKLGVVQLDGRKGGEEERPGDGLGVGLAALPDKPCQGTHGGDSEEGREEAHRGQGRAKKGGPCFKDEEIKRRVGVILQFYEDAAGGGDGEKRVGLIGAEVEACQSDDSDKAAARLKMMMTSGVNGSVVLRTCAAFCVVAGTKRGKGLWMDTLFKRLPKQSHDVATLRTGKSWEPAVTLIIGERTLGY